MIYLSCFFDWCKLSLRWWDAMVLSDFLFLFPNLEEWSLSSMTSCIFCTLYLFLLMQAWPCFSFFFYFYPFRCFTCRLLDLLSLLMMTVALLKKYLILKGDMSKKPTRISSMLLRQVDVSAFHGLISHLSLYNLCF